LISLFFVEKGSFFSAVSGLSRSLLSACDLPCLVFLVKRHANNNEETKFKIVARLYLELLVFKKRSNQGVGELGEIEICGK